MKWVWGCPLRHLARRLGYIRRYLIMGGADVNYWGRERLLDREGKSKFFLNPNRLGEMISEKTNRLGQRIPPGRGWKKILSSL